MNSIIRDDDGVCYVLKMTKDGNGMKLWVYIWKIKSHENLRV